MSCQHIFTYGPRYNFGCEKLATSTGYCTIHSIQIDYWNPRTTLVHTVDPRTIRDFASFLMDFMDLSDITPDLVRDLFAKYKSIIQDCARSQWKTEEREELYDAVSDLLHQRGIKVI